MPELDLTDIKARRDAATPGPWGWFGNTDVHNIYLAAKHSGRLVVMGFRRFGMQSAQPTFAVRGRLEIASRLARYEVAPNAPDRSHPNVYRADLNGIKNPDAEFIAHARQDVDDLLAEVERLRKDAEEQAIALGEALDEAERLREQRDRARMAVDRVSRLFDSDAIDETGLSPDAVSDAIADVDQLCPGCWRIHGTWCHPYGGPMADPDPTALKRALDGGEMS